jgi:hypothetical protein
MTLKQFGNAAKASTAEPQEPPLKANVLDRQVTFNSPGTGQIAYVASYMAGDDGEIIQYGGMLNFLFSLLQDDDDRAYVKRSLRDQSLTMEDVEEILIWIVEEWSERPTKRPSDFSDGQRTTGKSSTANSRRVASRRSTSGSTASATRSTRASSKKDSED